jgi:hypothetical protein
MLTNLAALGIGLITAVGTPITAQANCAPDARGSNYPSHGAPAPAYPAYPSVPTYSPPAYPTAVPATLRWADHNRDGGVTRAEAHAYARTQFARYDSDRNGVLRGREARRANDEFAQAARGRDGQVTLSEYDASVMSRFYGLDVNRDGFLSNFELGGRGPSVPVAAPGNGVTWSWHWQL